MLKAIKPLWVLATCNHEKTSVRLIVVGDNPHGNRFRLTICHRCGRVVTVVEIGSMINLELRASGFKQYADACDTLARAFGRLAPPLAPRERKSE